MNKKRAIIIAVVLFLLIGLGTFVFAGSDESLNTEKNTNNNSNTPNNSNENNTTTNNNDEENSSNTEEGETGSTNNNSSTIAKTKDKIAPIANISYSSLENGTITVTITSNEEIKSVLGWVLSSDKKSISRTFTENKSGTITILDIAGNETIVNYTVEGIPSSSNIDNSYALALEAVEKAEDTLTQEDVNVAKNLVENVTDGTDTTELKDRIATIQNLLDVSALVEQLANKTNNAQNLNEMTAARNFESEKDIINAVSKLATSNIKTELEEELTRLNKLLSDLTAPTIEGIENGSSTNQNVTLTIADTNNVTIVLNDEEVTLNTIRNLGNEGTYNLVVTDDAYNTKAITFTIDKTAPVLTINNWKNLELEVGSTYVDEGATAIDAVDGEVEVTVSYLYYDKNGVRITPNPTEINLDKVGQFVIVYKAVDNSGNKVEKARRINVVDTTAPVLTINNWKNLELGVGSTYVDEGATAIDAVDGEVEVTVSYLYYDVNGVRITPNPTEINLDKVGQFVIVYKAVDNSGNKVEKARRINVRKLNVEFEFTAPESLVYDGTKKEYNVVLKDENGNIVEANPTIVYEAADGVRKDAINAGTYTLIAHYAGDANHNATYKRLTFEITKANTEFEFTAPESLVYDGAKKEYNVVLKDENGNIVEANPTIVYEAADGVRKDAINAGTYTLIAHYAGDANHNATYKRLAFEITKANTEFEFTAPESLVYDGAKKEYNVVLKDENGNIVEANPTIVYEAADGVRKDAINAETYTLIAHYAGDANHNATYKRLAFEITKATPTIELIEPNLVYDGTEKEYGINVIGANNQIIDSPDMVVTYKNALTGETLTSAPTKVGKYTLGIYVRPTDNYTRADKWINFDIETNIQLTEARVGSNLIDETNNTINNFNSFAIKFNEDITIKNFSNNQGFKIEFEYSTDGVNYTKSNGTVINNYWTGVLAKSPTEKYTGNEFTITAGSPILWSGTKVGNRWSDIYNAILATKDTENKVYVRTVFTVVQPTYQRTFTLEEIIYSEGGTQVSQRGLAQF